MVNLINAGAPPVPSGNYQENTVDRLGSDIVSKNLNLRNYWY